MKILFSVFLPLLLLVPFVSEAALVPVKCIEPGECGTCEFVEMVNNVVRWLVAIMSIMATGIFVYAGLMMVTSAGNESKLSQAKGLFVNVIIGLVLVLASYIIVNTIMLALVNTGSGLKFWNKIECVYPAKNIGDVPADYKVPGLYSSGTSQDFFRPGFTGNMEVYGAGDCSPANLQNYGFSESQANVMSCMTKYESGCDNGADASDNGLNSSARGVFQIVYGYSDKCHSLRLPECTKANGGVPLDCGKSDDYPGSACNNAASNFACNAAAAKCLLDGADSGVAAGYQHWTADHRASNQQKCIDTYAR